MKITLTDDWKKILRKAWSFRLAMLAALLSGVETVLPMLEPSMQTGIFSGLSFVVAVGAGAARIVAQPSMSK